MTQTSLNAPIRSELVVSSQPTRRDELIYTSRCMPSLPQALLAFTTLTSLAHAKMAAKTLPTTMDRWVLTQRPAGKFDASRDVEKRTEPIPELKSDDVLIEVEMLSVDAFVRTMLDEQAYHGRVEIGGAVPALGYGTVIAAGADAKASIGKRVLGMVHASSHAVGPMSMGTGFTQVLSIPGVPTRLSLSLLSAVTGLTAYVGCFKVLTKPGKGETAVVSAAAGGVGSIAVQLLKSTGCRVVGVAGGATKCAFCVDTLGCDAAVDYKADTFCEDLDEACPDGIHFFFDNAGGSTLEAVLDRLAMHSRVVICGAASQYSGNLNAGRDAKGRRGSVQGPASYLKLAERSSTMAGFNVMHHFSSLPGAIFNLCWMYWRGTVAVHEHVETGLDAFPAALEKMFAGGHCGKMLVDLSESA